VKRFKERHEPVSEILVDDSDNAGGSLDDSVFNVYITKETKENERHFHPVDKMWQRKKIWKAFNSQSSCDKA
jgi:hypothetical protein